jgi:AraC family transcriptional regulator
MARKKVDLSEAYEMFQKMRGTYVVCFDVNGLLPINEIAWDAGDKTILEAARRIESIASDDMLVLRIGGDEFALVTGKSEKCDAETYMYRILAFNDKPIAWNGREIPVFLRAGITRIPAENLRYSELFTEMHHTLRLSREGSRK